MLVAETEIRILSQSSDKVPAIELIQGRLLVRNPPSGSLKVGFSDRSVTAGSYAFGEFVLERTDRREYGRARQSSSAALSFIARRARWRCPPTRNRNR